MLWCPDGARFLAHKFLALLQTARLALDVNHGAVMQDAVQDSGGGGDVCKDLVPLGEGLVGGKDDGRIFVPPGNELKEQIRALDVPGKAADLINTVLKMGFLELLDELVAIHIAGKEAMLGRHKAQGGGEMGLAHTWRAEEYHVLGEGRQSCVNVKQQQQLTMSFSHKNR